MKEADIQSLFTKNIDTIKEELEKCGIAGSCAFELKIEKGTRFAYDRVAPHQIKYLDLVKNGTGCYHKISDSPIYTGMKSRFTVQKPFDCFILKGNAFVVICWYEERKKKELHFIDIDTFINTKKIAERKSMTYEESKNIASLIYNLNKNDR